MTRATRPALSLLSACLCGFVLAGTTTPAHAAHAAGAPTSVAGSLVSLVRPDPGRDGLSAAPGAFLRGVFSPGVSLVPASQHVARMVTLERKPAPKPALKPAPEPRPEPTEEPAPELPPEPAPPLPASFMVSSFNVLGSSHTRGRHGKPHMAPGPTRMRTALSLLGTHGVDIVGLQEMQPDQYRTLTSSAGATYDVYPGLAAGPLGVDNSIAWRQSVFTRESAQTIAIPYFNGHRRPMPYVLLRHIATGRKIWVANFHNPATNPKRGNNDGWRAKAAGIETALAARLHNQSGYPVLVTGDMNDRESYFCRLTSGAPMQAANGGSNTRTPGGCRPPAYPMPVDWIFGTNDLTFSGYVRDEGPLVRRTSDHPMIRTRVLLDDLDGLGTGSH